MVRKASFWFFGFLFLLFGSFPSCALEGSPLATPPGAGSFYGEESLGDLEGESFLGLEDIELSNDLALDADIQEGVKGMQASLDLAVGLLVFIAALLSILLGCLLILIFSLFLK